MISTRAFFTPNGQRSRLIGIRTEELLSSETRLRSLNIRQSCASESDSRCKRRLWNYERSPMRIGDSADSYDTRRYYKPINEDSLTLPMSCTRTLHKMQCVTIRLCVLRRTIYRLVRAYLIYVASLLREPLCGVCCSRLRVNNRGMLRWGIHVPSILSHSPVSFRSYCCFLFNSQLSPAMF